MPESIEYRTIWSKDEPPYGAFDDYIVIESSKNSNRFLIRPEEFDFMMDRVFNKWKDREIPYFKTPTNWNEIKGFNDIDEVPEPIEDPKEFINALKKINGTDKKEFAAMLDDDIKNLIQFLTIHKKEGFYIRKE